MSRLPLYLRLFGGVIRDCLYDEVSTEESQSTIQQMAEPYVHPDNLRPIGNRMSIAFMAIAEKVVR